MCGHRYTYAPEKVHATSKPAEEFDFSAKLMGLKKGVRRIPTTKMYWRGKGVDDFLDNFFLGVNFNSFRSNRVRSGLAINLSLSHLPITRIPPVILDHKLGHRLDHGRFSVLLERACTFEVLDTSTERVSPTERLSYSILSIH